MKSMTQDRGPRQPTRRSKRPAIPGVYESNRLPDLAANTEAGWVLIEEAGKSDYYPYFQRTPFITPSITQHVRKGI